jgi:hypothetical protein
MKPVLSRAARKAVLRASRIRKSRLVVTPTTSTCSSARARRESAISRSGPWAITLAIIGS